MRDNCSVRWMDGWLAGKLISTYLYITCTECESERDHIHIISLGPAGVVLLESLDLEYLRVPFELMGLHRAEKERDGARMCNDEQCCCCCYSGSILSQNDRFNGGASGRCNRRRCRC